MKTLLISGYGDIARRAVPRLEGRYAVQPLSRRHGFDLDRPETLAALPGADAVLHCAPPPSTGVADMRTTHLLAALAKGRILPSRVVYVSTSGVYGDCGGARVEESRAVCPQTDRARRRLDAEHQLALWCSARGVALVILRVPGIYAADRLPLERLRAGLPRPPRIARAQAAGRIPPELLSFMSESRRLANRRMKENLGVRLRFPTVFEGVPHSMGAA